MADNQIVRFNLSLEKQKIRIVMESGAYQENPDDVSTYHFHTDHELHYIKSGQYLFQIGSRKYQCGQNTLVILPPNTYHIIRTLGSGTKICFQYRVMEGRDDSPFLFDSCEHFFPYTMSEADILIDILNSFLKNRDPFHLLKLKSIFTIMVLNIHEKITQLHQAEKLSNYTVSTDQITSILSFIYENFIRKILLREVADHVFLSERQVTRIIKAETGKTFINFLSQYRIEYAKKLIAETDLSFRTISASVGFLTYNHFWKMFQNFEKISPSDYKKRLTGSCAEIRDIQEKEPVVNPSLSSAEPESPDG